MLFQSGKVKLSSGLDSDWRINAEYLTKVDLETCAYLLSKLLPSFSEVEGVPSGGLALADAMSKYKSSGKLLIVDDVWTTGRSWHNYRDGRDAIGAIIFARGDHPENVISLWAINSLLK